ncbi:MAG: hypothetical protein J6S01_06105, partial [Bacteroidales bacterium]|nr:hypothetical protein [Bacteroidales bacterium]
MKIYARILPLLISVSLLLSGCGKEPQTQKEPQQPTGFVELVQAYKDGRVFKSAEHQDGCCVLSF